MYNFKFSAFADEAGKSADEQIKALGVNGIHYIEVRNIEGKNILDLDDEELKALKKKFDSGGIKFSAIGSPIGKSPIEESFGDVKTAFERALRAAEILDAKYIRAFSFFMPKDADPMKYADEVIRRLTELVKIASQRGKKYALENESRIFTDIPERCAYVFERVPGLCLAFDPGNFIMNDADPLKAWKLLKKWVEYFHIKDGSSNPRRFVPAGEGIGSISEILKEAYSAGFDGFLSIEPHLGYLENLNDQQRFATAANALKKLLNQTFNAGLKSVEI
ncbi:MAG: sugar phosphate isomerase/epimerase [Treponema sp.]|nr:sugar phosphate isomerase/epimerase [Treponema sp.]